MMGISRSRRGFSLIEAMIVVCLVGILAVVATLAYRRWRQTAYLSEAQDMVNNIRAAEESFRAENGGYLGITTTLGILNDYPARTPGPFKTAWGGPCSWCAAQWSALNVQASAPLMFGYSVVAGNDPNAPSGGFHLPLNGQELDIANGMPAPWYVIEADGDTDGNSVFSHVYGVSATNQIFIDSEGE